MIKIGPVSPNDGFPRLGLSAENKGPGSAQAQFHGLAIELMFKLSRGAAFQKDCRIKYRGFYLSKADLGELTCDIRVIVFIKGPLIRDCMRARAWA